MEARMRRASAHGSRAAMLGFVVCCDGYGDGIRRKRDE
jgi:hypothetical protein